MLDWMLEDSDRKLKKTQQREEWRCYTYIWIHLP